MVMKFVYEDLPPVPKQSARFAAAAVPAPGGGAFTGNRMTAADYQRMVKGGGAPQATGGKVVSYRDKKVEAFANAIGFMTRRQLPRDFEPLDGQLIAVKITFMFKVPAGRDYKHARAVLAEGGKVYKITKPDCDNLTKAYLDGVEGLVYKNDAAVARQEVEKVWGLKDAIYATFTVGSCV